MFSLALALNADALSPTDEQRAIFVRATSPGATTEAVNAATSLGRDLGIKQDLFALDYLITSNYVRYVEAFGVGWRQFQDSKKESKIDATREYESRIAKHFDNGEIVAALLRGINTYESPELFELFYKDAIKLATHRANRRQHCRAQITQVLPAPPESLDAHNVRVRVPLSSKPGYEFRIQDLESNDWLIWRYNCGPMTTDDPRSDLDGKPLVGPGNGQRELKSISAIGRTNLPGIEVRLAKLFLNLSLMPRSDWGLVGGRPEYLRLPSWAFERYGHRVTHFASWFTERGLLPPAADVLTILKELESDGLATALSREDSSLAQFLLQLLPKPRTRGEAEFFATWIERLLANEDAKIRQGHITNLLPLLGGLPPSAQIDLTRLKRKAFESVPYDQVAMITDLFKRIEGDNLSLSKPDADSLARAMFYQTAEKMVPAILAAGVNPNEISPKYGDPALVLAARRQEKLIPFLLSNGANVNVHDKSGTTALHLVSDIQLASRSEPSS